MQSGLAPKTLAFKAGAAVEQYNFVKFGSADDTVIECSADDEKVLGVAQNAATAAGDLLEVALADGALVKLGATLSRGDAVATSSGGVAKAIASGGFVAGHLLKGGVSGDVVPMLIRVYQDKGT